MKNKSKNATTLFLTIGCLMFFSCNDSGANRLFTDVELDGFKGPVKSITEIIDDEISYDSFNAEGFRVLRKLGTKQSLSNGGGFTFIFKKNKDNVGYSEELKNGGVITIREFDRFGNLTLRSQCDSGSGDTLSTQKINYSDFGIANVETINYDQGDDHNTTATGHLFEIERDSLGRMQSKHYKKCRNTNKWDDVLLDYSKRNSFQTHDDWDQFYFYDSYNNIKSAYRVVRNGGVIDTTQIKYSRDKYGNIENIIEILNGEKIKEVKFLINYYQ